MAIEIERKFLVRSDVWRGQVTESASLQQAYLSIDPARCIRVRIAGEQAHINLKSSSDGISRHEYEYAIPLMDAREMLERMRVGSVIDKTRHLLPMGELLWEVDEFHGDNAGLIVAEIELPSVNHAFGRPDWLGEEVSSDARVYNMNLAVTPYQQWQDRS